MNNNPTSQRMNIVDLHYGGAYNELLCTPDNLPFTGVVYEALPSGSLTAEYEVEDGLKNGTEIEYFSEGFPEMIAHYRQGELHGEIVFYYPGGGVKEKSIFEYGICTEEFVWDENGTLVRHKILELEKFQRVMLENSRRENS